MPHDGHSGSRVDTLDTLELQDFALCLTLLHQVDGSARFVVHISPKRYNRGGLSPDQFLLSLGFHQEPRGCPFFGDGCFYDDGILVRQIPVGAVYANETEEVRRWFRNFTEQLPLLYAVRMREESLLDKIGLPLPKRYDFPTGVELTFAQGEEPLWVEEEAFRVMREAKSDVRQALSQWERWKVLNTLLYGTGDKLVDAVVDALKMLQLDARLTEPGATIDVYASTYNQQHKFGIEVTGLNDAIKKKCNKLTQLTTFERTKEDDEKASLVAATFNRLPVGLRDQEDYTQEVIDYFAGRDVLLMTGLDLFKLCGKVADGELTWERAVENLIQQRGRFAIPEEAPYLNRHIEG